MSQLCGPTAEKGKHPVGVDRQLNLQDIRTHPSEVPTAAGDSTASLCAAVSNMPPGRRGADEDGDERTAVLSIEGKLKKLKLCSLEARSINNTLRGQKRLLWRRTQ